MSNELSKEQKLIAIVIAHPAGAAQRPCALERLTEYDPFKEYQVIRLYEAAEPLGFSPYECDAIIAGWDGAVIPTELDRAALDQTWLSHYDLGFKMRLMTASPVYR